MYRELSQFVCRTSIARFVFLPLFVWLSLNTEVAAQNFWQQTNGPYGGTIEALAIKNSNGHFFAGTDGGGIFRSTDSGSNWTPINTGLTNTQVLSLAINSSGDIFAGTFGGGVFRSTDNGNVWVDVSTDLTNKYIHALVINSSGDIFAGAEGGGVFRSRDNGNSWTVINSGLTDTDVRALAINPNGHIFAGTFDGGGIFRSTNDGNGWEAVNTGLTYPHIRSLAINSSGHIFAGTDEAGAFRSTNNGNNWTEINNNLTHLEVYALAANPAMQDTIFAGTDGGGVFRSTDNGDNWVSTGTLTNANVHSLAITANENILAGTEGNGVFISQNNGNTWTAIHNGLTGLLVYALAANSIGDVFAGTFAGGVFRLQNNGSSWMTVNNGLTNTFVNALVINPSGDIFAGTEDGGVFRSQDNGGSWVAVNTDLTNFFVYAFAIKSNGDIFAGTKGGVFRSPNNGDSWTVVNNGLTNTFVKALAINSSGHIFAGTDGNGVFRSTNGGSSWAAVNIGLTNTDLLALAINASGNIFAGTFGGGVFRSLDSGGSWTEVNIDLTNKKVRAFAINSSGHIFAGTDGGVFRSLDNGNNWTAVNNGLTSTTVRALNINASGYIFAGALGGGVLRSVESTTLSYIKIVEGTSGSAPELGSKNLTTDQTLTVHAAGYDANNNYLGDQSVTWSVSNNIGTLSTPFGTTTTLDARTPGSGVITADHAAATDDVTGTITVSVGAAQRVKVLNGASGNTTEVTTLTLIAGQMLTVHASSFDVDENRLGDVSVNWSVSGGIGTLNPTSGASTTLTATIAGSGVITADHVTLIDDATGNINVVPGALSAVKIIEGSSGNSPELTTKNLTTDQTLIVHAAGYDANNNYLGDFPVNWSVSNSIGTLSTNIGTTTTLDARTPGSGVIMADHVTATDDLTGTITVGLGAAQHAKVLNGASGETSEVTALTLTTGQTLVVHASSFDADGNRIGDVNVMWSLSGGIGTLNATSGASTTLTATTVGSGVITANHATLVDDATETITVIAEPNLAPLAPTLLSPSVNALTNDNTPDFIFKVPSDSNDDQLHFRVEIDGDGNFGPGTQTFESRNSTTGFSPMPPVTQGNGQVTYTVQSALADGDWWWRVSAWDGKVYGDSSTARKFIIDATSPFTSNHNPARGVTGVPVNTNIVAHVQDAASGVTRSSIVMKVNDNTVTPLISGMAADYTLTYDPPDSFGFRQIIKVSIDAADSTGNAMATDAYSFTTVTQGNSAPAAPALVSPPVNAFIIGNTPALVFSVPADSNGDQLHFRVEIDDDGNFDTGTQTLESKNSTAGFSPTPPVAQGTGQITYTVQSALADGDWWWRVTAWDSTDYGNFSMQRKFSVDTTKPFTSNRNPDRGATGVPISTNIVAHVQDATSGVARSSIVMKVNGNSVVPSITGTAADYTLTYDPPLDFTTQQMINVSVDAADSAGNMMATDSYSFTTSAQANSAPVAPTLISPAANMFTNDNTPALAFNVPADPDGDLLHFKIEIDDDNNFGAGTQTFESRNNTNGFSPPPPVTPGTGQATYTVQSALASGDWWWRVSAWDGQVYGEISRPRKFIVDASPPLINHFRVSSAISGQSQTIPATITDNFGILSAVLYFRMGGASAYAAVPMANISGAAYEGIIPNTAVTERGVEYYFSIEDSANNIRNFPNVNPQSSPQVIQVRNNNLFFLSSTPVKAYRMISAPFDLDNKSAASVFGDDFPGNYDQVQWRLLRYVDPQTNTEFGNSGFPALVAGTGFWLITRDAKLLDAGAGISITTAQNYSITLPPGWSQIGNPFAFTVNWSDVIKGANVENSLVGYQGSLNEATGYDYTRTQMVSFEGYFVNNKGSSPTTIEIPPKAVSGSAATKQMADWKSALQGNEWGIQITAACDRYLDKDNYLGNLNDASDEWDANDFSEAPFFDQHVALYFPHPEWKKYPDLYTGDFRETKAEGDYWDFVVRSEVAKSEVARSEVVLRLAEVQNLPADWEIILLDKASRVAINFSEKKEYTFPSGNGKTVREFRVVVGRKEFVETNDLNLAGVPQAFALGQNYPNPFNPETRINYELPAINRVKITIYNLSGQLVRTLFDGEQSVGRYTVSWDGVNAVGDRVASGVYLVRMEASPSTGSGSTGSGRGFVTVRKMVLAR